MIFDNVPYLAVWYLPCVHNNDFGSICCKDYLIMCDDATYGITFTYASIRDLYQPYMYALASLSIFECIWLKLAPSGIDLS
jgi:hypothetical protein